MGSSTSSMSAEPVALKKGIQIIDRALDEQYKMLEEMAAECNNLRDEQKKTEEKAVQLRNKYRQCRSALEVLSQRDAELRRSVATTNKRYAGQYKGTDPTDSAYKADYASNGQNRSNRNYGQ